MLTKEIIDYIRSERALGATRESIGAALRQAGWSEQDIVDAFTAATPPMPTPRPAAPAQANNIPIAPIMSDVTTTARRYGPPNQPVNPAIHSTYRKTIDTFERNERRKSHKGIFVILFTLSMGAGIWFYITKPDIPAALNTIEQRVANRTTNQAAPADPLLVTIKRVPELQNAAQAIIFSDSAALDDMTAAEKDFLKTYIENFSTKKLPPLTQSATIVKKHEAILTAFDEAIALPYYQCLPLAGDTCNLTVPRTLSHLALLKAYVTYKKEKNPDDALTHALAIGTFGSKIAGSGDVIPLTAGFSMQKNAYTLASYIASSVPASAKPIVLTPAEKTTLVTTVQQNVTNTIRFLYTKDMSAIAFISNPNASTTFPLSQETREELSSLTTYVTPTNWRPDETRLYYLRSYQKAIENVKAPCTNTEPATTKYDPGFAEDAAVESDNYIGKLIFTNSYQEFDKTLFTKRCELEKVIGDL